MNKNELENQIQALFKLWIKEKDKQEVNKVRYAGPVLGEKEYENILDSIFSDWWSGGKYTVDAELKLAKLSDRNFGLLTNSGSSANLVLMSGAKELYFKDDDKILTLSCGFPTTVNPIITNRLKPLFVDINLDDLSLDPQLFEDVVKKDNKVKGVFIAHTLGYKGPINEILNIARKYNIKVFFDCCDAYGTMYNGRPIQSYGKASTYSFYVAHHITMGEGGGITTNDHDLHLTMRGFRNWGRYCASTNCCIRSSRPDLFCPTSRLSKDCQIPDDYIVNYTYEWLGYNLKPLELQAAMLIAQLDRLKEFDSIRKQNYSNLYNYFSSLDVNFKLWEIDSDVSPFSFPILLPPDVLFTRKHLIDHMARAGIETRLLFGGNLTKHPSYVNNSKYWESYGTHHNSDNIMNNFIMFGVSQVNKPHHIEKIKEEMSKFLKQW